MAEGIFENDWFLNVPRGTNALKQVRLEKIPKYSPHCSLCSKGRRILVLFSNFSIRINTDGTLITYKKQFIENNILFRSETSSEASVEPRDRYIFSIQKRRS